MDEVTDVANINGLLCAVGNTGSVSNPDTKVISIFLNLQAEGANLATKIQRKC